MSKKNSPSITLEEAVARMVNMDFIPTGFTLLEMTAAFEQEAETEHANARSGYLPDGETGPLSADLIERLRIRLEVCEARNSLAHSLTDAIRRELADPEGSLVSLPGGPSMAQRLTLESLIDWSTNRFGIGTWEWLRAHYQEIAKQKSRWEKITIKIYADYKIGCFFEDGQRKRSSFQAIGLMGERKIGPNQRGAILVGLSQKKKFPSGNRAQAKDATAISKLRGALVLLTGLTSDPFYPLNEADGWKPRFGVDNKVEHYLDDAQLERLLKVLHSDPNRTVCLIALFLISTGCRLNEVLSARWKQIDRVNRVFRVDAINSKSKRVRSVPLNDSALEVLEQLDTEGKYEHLFINKKTGEPYTTIMKVWTRLRAKAGLPHLRIHDLRHQFASFLVNSGRTLYEVQQLLGHSDSKVTQRYAHLSSKTLQDAANSASAIMKGSMKKAA